MFQFYVPILRSGSMFRFYVPARAARAAGTARITPTLQNDRKSKFEEQKRCIRILFYVGVNFSRIRGGEGKGGGGRPGRSMFRMAFML